MHEPKMDQNEQERMRLYAAVKAERERVLDAIDAWLASAPETTELMYLAEFLYKLRIRERGK